MNRLRGVAVAVTIAMAMTACQADANTAEGTAEGFLDAHYVRMNLAEAKKYCVGVARSKIEEMQHLVGDQMIDEETRKPHVSYELKETREEGEGRVSFVFEGRIRVDGADDFTRRWLVNTRKSADGQWQVSNFQEFE